MPYPMEKALGERRPLGSPGCEYDAGNGTCNHRSNELGLCLTALCPVNVEVTDKGRQALHANQCNAGVTAIRWGDEP